MYGGWQNQLIQKQITQKYLDHIVKVCWLSLKRGKYNSGRRPSDHVVGKKSFLTDHKGSIMPNFIEMDKMDGE